MEAVLCPKIQYASLSADSNLSDSIERQQNANIKISADRDENKVRSMLKKENRNLKREGAARQAKDKIGNLKFSSISWSPTPPNFFNNNVFTVFFSHSNS